MKKESEKVALFDLDGTLCDYDASLFEELEKLRSPLENRFSGSFRTAPPHIVNRADLIRSNEEWWANLPKLSLGWDIFNTARNIGYRIMILTQGPRKNPAAWAGKIRWRDKHLGEDTDITITRDKGLVYGRVLVDDFPDYAERWLGWRKNGLVIMPANSSNSEYRHNQVIRYTGENLKEIETAMKKAFER